MIRKNPIKVRKISAVDMEESMAERVCTRKHCVCAKRSYVTTVLSVCLPVHLYTLMRCIETTFKKVKKFSVIFYNLH